MTGQSRDWSRVMAASRVCDVCVGVCMCICVCLQFFPQRKFSSEYTVNIFFFFKNIFPYMTCFFIFLMVFQRPDSFSFDKPSLFFIIIFF